MSWPLGGLNDTLVPPIPVGANQLRLPGEVSPTATLQLNVPSLFCVQLLEVGSIFCGVTVICGIGVGDGDGGTVVGVVGDGDGGTVVGVVGDGDGGNVVGEGVRVEPVTTRVTPTDAFPPLEVIVIVPE